MLYLCFKCCKTLQSVFNRIYKSLSSKFYAFSVDMVYKRAKYIYVKCKWVKMQEGHYSNHFNAVFKKNNPRPQATFSIYLV